MGAALAGSSQSTPETKGPGSGSAGGAGGEHARPAWRRWLELRGAWLLAALGLAAMAVALAVALPLRQDVHRPAKFTDPRWWVEPQETNAFARLPVVRSQLRRVAIAPDGRLALAVGSDGTLLRSTDAGATWQGVASGTQQELWGIAIAPDGRLATRDGARITQYRAH